MNEQKNIIHLQQKRVMDKKAELLVEARQVFAEKGYNKTNISDIAKRVRDCWLFL